MRDGRGKGLVWEGEGREEEGCHAVDGGASGVERDGCLGLGPGHCVNADDRGVHTRGQRAGGEGCGCAGEVAYNYCDEIGAHRDGASRSKVPQLTIRRTRAGSEGEVGQHNGGIGRFYNGNVEHGLEGRLVHAGPGAARVSGLEVGGDDVVGGGAGAGDVETSVDLGQGAAKRNGEGDYVTGGERSLCSNCNELLVGLRSK